MTKPKLSILIPSTPDRERVLQRLIDHLEVQKKYINDPNDVEILINIDNREKSIGRKRNELVAEAKGEYTVFIDSDDLVSPTYLESILRAIEQKPDAIGLKMNMLTSGVLCENSWHSSQFEGWKTYQDPIEPSKRFFTRGIHHLCPTKSSITKSLKYPEISMGEDKDYSERVAALIKTEVFPQEVLYYYLFDPNK